MNDRPRPDLDAAIDAVVPALTTVSDEAAAHSLRRTRTALAGDRREGGLGAWRWAIPALVTSIAAIAAVAWWPATPVDGPKVVILDHRRPAPPAPLPATAPPVAAVASMPPRVPATRLTRTQRVEPTSAPRADEAPAPDPMLALVRAVQEIPDDAWDRSVAQSSATLAVPPLVLDSIRVEPLQIPALADTPSAESPAPGEP